MSYPDYLLENSDTQGLEILIKLIKSNQEEINRLHSKINKLTQENETLKHGNKDLREKLLNECEQCIELMNMISDEE